MRIAHHTQHSMRNRGVNEHHLATYAMSRHQRSMAARGNIMALWRRHQRGISKRRQQLAACSCAHGVAMARMGAGGGDSVAQRSGKHTNQKANSETWQRQQSVISVCISVTA